MLFLSLITLIMCKALINDKLFIEFYHRISAIILLFSAILSINSIFNIGSLSGIGIYGGLFNISTISQILESFLLIIASLILVSWPNKLEVIKEVSINPSSAEPSSFLAQASSSSTAFATQKKKEDSYLYSLVNSILLKNNRNNSILSNSINNSVSSLLSIANARSNEQSISKQDHNNNILIPK